MVSLTPIYFRIVSAVYSADGTPLSNTAGHYLLIETPEGLLSPSAGFVPAKIKYTLTDNGAVDLLLAPGKYYKVTYVHGETKQPYLTQYWKIPSIFMPRVTELKRSNSSKDYVGPFNYKISDLEFVANQSSYEVIYDDFGTYIVWADLPNAPVPGSNYKINIQQALSLKDILDTPGYLSVS